MWVIIKWRNGLNITNMIDTHQPRPGQTAIKGLGDRERERDSHQIYFSGYEVHALERKSYEHNLLCYKFSASCLSLTQRI